jgi:DNA ligase-1
MWGARVNTPFYEPLLAVSLLASKVPTTDENIYEAMKQLKYPVFVTTKMDGVRAVRLDGTLKSRTRKLIQNPHIRDRSLILSGGFDVELANPSLEFNEVSGIVRRKDCTPEDAEKVEFYVLDWFLPEKPYAERLFQIGNVMIDMPPWVHFEIPTICHNPNELMQMFLEVEDKKGEGICFRTPLSPYSQKYPQENRSTLKEQFLVKLTRFVYEEAIIVGFEEQMENGNPSVKNAAGKSKRSHDAGRMYGKGTLGAYHVSQLGKPNFKVPASHSDFLRQEVWKNQNRYLGKTLRFKHKPHGRLNKPRSPIFDGFREQGT